MIATIIVAFIHRSMNDEYCETFEDYMSYEDRYNNIFEDLSMNTLSKQEIECLKDKLKNLFYYMKYNKIDFQTLFLIC